MLDLPSLPGFLDTIRHLARALAGRDTGGDVLCLGNVAAWQGTGGGSRSRNDEHVDCRAGIDFRELGALELKGHGIEERSSRHEEAAPGNEQPAIIYGPPSGRSPDEATQVTARRNSGKERTVHGKTMAGWEFGNMGQGLFKWPSVDF